MQELPGRIGDTRERFLSAIVDLTENAFGQELLVTKNCADRCAHFVGKHRQHVTDTISHAVASVLGYPIARNILLSSTNCCGENSSGRAVNVLPLPVSSVSV